jgi:hypothetical protein
VFYLFGTLLSCEIRRNICVLCHRFTITVAIEAGLEATATSGTDCSLKSAPFECDDHLVASEQQLKWTNRGQSDKLAWLTRRMSFKSSLRVMKIA